MAQIKFDASNKESEKNSSSRIFKWPSTITS